MVTWKPPNLQRTFSTLLPFSEFLSKIKPKVNQYCLGQNIHGFSETWSTFRPGVPDRQQQGHSQPLHFPPRGVSIRVPCLSVSVDKGALQAWARWMFPLASLEKSFPHSSPVIAGVHGRGAGIGTVHKVINNNAHDRWGPLKVPVMQ